MDCGEILRAETEIDSLSIRGAGSRSLLSHAWCRQLGTLVKGQPTVSSLLSKDAVAVQCILFAKSSVRNWLVRMHRDRSFPVKRRTSEADWAGWSWKEGKLFARPPRKIVESLLAVCVHLDETNEQTGALQVVPESHRDDGKVGPRVVCSVSKGGLLVMHPSLLHASLAGKALADDVASGLVQGREERRRPVALVLGRAPRGLPRTQRQHRLGAVQRLDLRFLVHA